MFMYRSLLPSTYLAVTTNCDIIDRHEEGSRKKGKELFNGRRLKSPTFSTRPELKEKASRNCDVTVTQQLTRFLADSDYLVWSHSPLGAGLYSVGASSPPPQLLQRERHVIPQRIISPYHGHVGCSSFNTDL